MIPQAPTQQPLSLDRNEVIGNVGWLQWFAQHYNAQKVAGPQALAFPIVPTASLPAAGASMNGVICIEQAGGGAFNIITYAGNNRYRLSVGSSF